MIFKGISLEAGDLVSFQTKTVPLPEIQAAVIGMENGALEVMSTLLAPFQHSGKFTEDEVEQITVIHTADVAVPKESHKNFSKNQKVLAKMKDGQIHQGRIIAAFDGIIVARRNDGQFIVGGTSYFNAI